MWEEILWISLKRSGKRYCGSRMVFVISAALFVFGIGGCSNMKSLQEFHGAFSKSPTYHFQITSEELNSILGVSICVMELNTSQI